MTAWWTLVGIGCTVAALLAWGHVPDMPRLERQAAADGLLSDHLRIHKAGRDVRTTRGFILTAGAVGLVGAIGFLSLALPWVWAVVAAATLPMLARAGRPAGKPIVTAATLPATVQAPDQDVITRALGSLGIAGVDRWLRDGRPLVFTSPVREDGPAGGPRSTCRSAPRWPRNRSGTSRRTMGRSPKKPRRRSGAAARASDGERPGPKR
jgi:hypothetical protein